MFIWPFLGTEPEGEDVHMIYAWPLWLWADTWEINTPWHDNDSLDSYSSHPTKTSKCYPKHYLICLLSILWSGEDRYNHSPVADGKRWGAEKLLLAVIMLWHKSDSSIPRPACSLLSSGTRAYTYRNMCVCSPSSFKTNPSSDPPTPSVGM